MNIRNTILSLASGLLFSLVASAQIHVDTLSVGDGHTRVVLNDDHSWYYIRETESVPDVYADNWVVDAINPYESMPLSEMPVNNPLCLVDSSSVFVSPLKGKVFAGFGARSGYRHQGVDLPLSAGTPVVAAFDGIVRAAMEAPGYGNVVIVRHNNGLETYYGCLSECKVKPGDAVHAGDAVGLGGSTGLATAPHLHFEMRYRGFAIDPESLVDFENGSLRSHVFVLRRNYLDPVSNYVSSSIGEEEEIYAAEERIVAEAARKAAEKAAMRYHKVRQGDTVSGICHKYGISLARIKQLNPKLNVDRISLGQSIRVN